MGFILDAIGAGAGAGADILADQRKSDLAISQQKAIGADLEARQMRLAEYNSRLEQNRAKMLEGMRVARIPLEAKSKAEADEQVTASRAKSFEAARKGIIEKTIADKANKFYADGRVRQFSDLAEEELTVPELQLNDRERAAATREAGLQTGQLSIKDALADESKGADLDRKYADMESKSEFQRAMLDLRAAKNAAEHQAAMARIEAMASRVSGKNDVAGLRLGYSIMLKEAGQNMREAQKRLADLPDVAMNRAARQKLMEEIDSYKEEQSELKAMLNDAITGKPTKAPAQDGSGGSKPPAGAGPKKGDKRPIAAGPNKGKTAVFDGKGWVLQQ